jgi:hypothetical protein
MFNDYFNFPIERNFVFALVMLHLQKNNDASWIASLKPMFYRYIFIAESIYSNYAPVSSSCSTSANAKPRSASDHPYLELVAVVDIIF